MEICPFSISSYVPFLFLFCCIYFASCFYFVAKKETKKRRNANVIYLNQTILPMCLFAESHYVAINSDELVTVLKIK